MHMLRLSCADMSERFEVPVVGGRRGIPARRPGDEGQAASYLIIYCHPWWL